MFSWLFGEEEPKPAEPTLEEASDKINNQINNLDAKIERCTEEARKYVAKSSSDPAAKKKALEILKRKKTYETQREQLVSTQFNLETLADQQQHADITAMTVAAMEGATMKMKAAHAHINVSKVEDLTDNLAECNHEMQEVNKLLGRSQLAGISAGEEMELSEEYAMIEEEMVAETLAGLVTPPPLVKEARVTPGMASQSSVPQRADALPAFAYS